MKKGEKHSKEAKKKISLSGKGRKHSEEARKRISKAHKGKKLSEEHKRKLSESHKGKNRGNKNSLGHKHTDKTKRKMSKTRQKPLEFIVDKNGCFIIISHSIEVDGRVRFIRNGRRMLAHRFIFEECFGFIPEGMFVCHSCDVGGCMNPKHLFLGTQKENIQDMISKGRQAKFKGEKHGMAKLTEEQVFEIRANKNLTIKQLGRKYGISPNHACCVKNRQSWKHI